MRHQSTSVKLLNQHFQNQMARTRFLDSYLGTYLSYFSEVQAFKMIVSVTWKKLVDKHIKEEQSGIPMPLKSE